MHKDEALPAVLLGTPLKEAIVRMSEKGLGMLAVTDAEGRLKGVFTDGDLRRLFQERDSFAGLKWTTSCTLRRKPSPPTAWPPKL